MAAGPSVHYVEIFCRVVITLSIMMTEVITAPVMALPPYLITNDVFRRIQSNQEDIKSEFLIFRNCSTPNPPIHGLRVPKFKNCTTAVFRNNNREFNYFWISKVSMPAVERIYFDGELNPDVFYRFDPSVWIFRKGSYGYPNLPGLMVIQGVEFDKMEFGK